MANTKVQSLNKSKYFGFIYSCYLRQKQLFNCSGMINSESFRVFAKTQTGLYEVESIAKDFQAHA
jgi:hypothetical protein